MPEATGGSRSGRGGWAASGELLSCSFCGRRQTELEKLIAGRGVYICDGCTDRVHAVLAAPGQTASTPVATIEQVSDGARDAWCGFCGAGRRQVEAMAAAGDARICNECLDLCEEIIRDEPA